MDKLPFSVYDFLSYLASGFLILAAFDFVQSQPTILRDDVGFFPGAFWILAAYVVGHLIASVASALYERLIVGRWLGRPSRHLLEDNRRGWRAFLLRAYLTPLPPRVVARVRERADRAGGHEGEDLFLLAFGEAKQHPDLMARMQTFLNLYGFSRNMSAAALIAVIVVGGGALVIPGVDAEQALGWVAAGLVVSVGMFYRYLKFFRQYSFELFVSWVALPASGGR